MKKKWGTACLVVFPVWIWVAVYHNGKMYPIQSLFPSKYIFVTVKKDQAIEYWVIWGPGIVLNAWLQHGIGLRIK